jgi:hypothetical protein
MVRAIATESTCLLAALTKVHLAYIIGTRDQKLTVSISKLQVELLLIIGTTASNHKPRSANGTGRRVPNALLTMVQEHKRLS